VEQVEYEVAELISEELDVDHSVSESVLLVLGRENEAVDGALEGVYVDSLSVGSSGRVCGGQNVWNIIVAFSWRCCCCVISMWRASSTNLSQQEIESYNIFNQ
jgi:hypothetical protein